MTAFIGSGFDGAELFEFGEETLGKKASAVEIVSIGAASRNGRMQWPASSRFCFHSSIYPLSVLRAESARKADRDKPRAFAA